MQLKEKVAVVTGASSGIGMAIAKKLVEGGAYVVVAARRKEKLEQFVKELNEMGEGKALAVPTDVSSREAVEKMVSKAEDAFGAVDIYVNNAGQMLQSKLTDGHVEDWEQMIDVNIKGVLYGIQSVLPNMLQRSAGHIINIASVSGLEVTKMSSVYSATKYAVRAISIGLEKELARTGVRVTNISPGMVETELSSRRGSMDRDPLQTNDIAKAVVYAVTQPAAVNVNEITIRPV